MHVYTNCLEALARPPCFTRAIIISICKTAPKTLNSKDLCGINSVMSVYIRRYMHNEIVYYTINACENMRMVKKRSKRISIFYVHLKFVFAIFFFLYRILFSVQNTSLAS